MDGQSVLEERRETAELLLKVARQLAVATRRGTVSQTIADSMVGLGAPRAAVTLLDETQAGFHATAAAGWPEALNAAASAFSAQFAEFPEVADLLNNPRQHFVTARDASEGVRRDLAAYRVEAYLATPVVAGDLEPHGFLFVFWPTAPEVVPAVLAERLAGIADLAAVALDNVQLIERIRRDADQDALTGLANRATLHRELTRAIHDAGCAITAVIFIDIDHFKRINDALGHLGGDTLLQQVSARLRTVARTRDTIARPGGDEFVIVLPEIRNRDDVDGFVDRLQRSFKEPFHVDGARVFVSLSLGTATTHEPGSESLDQTAEDLLAVADSRMYDAKRSRHIGSATARDVAGLDLETALHDAVADGSITAHFQAQYDLHTGRLSGFEALARWHHAEMGWISPSVFIPLAEDTGLIAEIGTQVLRQACEFIDRAAAQQDAPLQMQVNASTVELALPGFAEQVLAILSAWPARQWRLNLEVTESDFIIDRPRVEGALKRLREHGIGVAIDDFGSGYSSLSQLQELPATEIKIDRRFIVREGAVAVDVVRAIIALGRSLNLVVVAEGVETDQQLTTLRDLECDRAQGFLFAPPLPADAAVAVQPTIDSVLQILKQEKEHIADGP